MKNWHDESVTISNECPWIEDSNDALIVSQQLGIPFQTIDLSQEYKHRIVDYMFEEYKSGRTPNPDILCNREIKFDVFLERALELGADFVATGHYCRKDIVHFKNQLTYRLLAGKDNNKDQSYFLCQVSQTQLEKVLFPIGELTKPEVRAIAEEIGLATANKKDSQGLCFIGKVRLPEFLKQQLAPKEGNVILIDPQHPQFTFYNDSKVNQQYDLLKSNLFDLSKSYHFTESDGKVIGQHEGAHFYTIGQRKGLGIGGFEKPLFVIGTDTIHNSVFVGHSEDHPGLYRPALFIPKDVVHWIRPDLELELDGIEEYTVRIRYRQPLETARLYKVNEGIYIVFKNLQKGIAKGQFAAWYKKDELIGSGVID